MELTEEQFAEKLKQAASDGTEAVLPRFESMMDAKLAELAKSQKAEPEGEPAPDPDNKASEHIWVKEVEVLRTDKSYMASAAYDEEGKDGAFGRFLKDVYTAGCAPYTGGGVPERLAKWSAVTKPTMNEGTDEQGGFLVPSDFGPHLAATSLEPEIVQGRGARMFNLRGNRISMPADVDATHIGSFFGGVTVYRPDEAGAKTPSKPTYRQMVLTLHKLIVFVDVTDELIEDAAMSVEADISRKARAAITFTKDDDFVNGTGVGMALGLLSAITPGGPVISVPARPAQPANTIIYENIVDMWARLFSRSQSNSIWMVNQDTFPQLATMNMAVGAGGGPVFIPAGGASAAPYATLMGRPMITTEKCQALGTQGDIILADWSQYAIAQKAGGIKAASSIHLYFNYDKQVFRFVLRYDGQPTWAIDLTPRRGATVSPFVVLATRP